MKKVLLSTVVRRCLDRERSFLDRTDTKILVAETGDDALRMHRTEHADLIIAHLDMPGMEQGGFCTRIRQDAQLGAVPFIMTCANTPEAVRMSSACGSTVVLVEPVVPMLLVAKAQQLLHIPGRDSIRVTLSSDLDLRSGGGSFYGHARNISTTGMLIETDRLLAEGAGLSCRFYLPVARQVQASGRVVRIIGHGPDARQYGLLFTELAEEMRGLIEEYVGTCTDRDEN